MRGKWKEKTGERKPVEDCNRFATDRPQTAIFTGAHTSTVSQSDRHFTRHFTSLWHSSRRLACNYPNLLGNEIYYIRRTIAQLPSVDTTHTCTLLFNLHFFLFSHTICNIRCHCSAQWYWMALTVLSGKRICLLPLQHYWELVKTANKLV